MARFFIDRPIFAWVIAIIVMLAGVLSITQLPATPSNFGTLAGSLRPVTSAITGKVANPVTGTLAGALATVRLNSAGSVANPITGTLDGALRVVTAALAGVPFER